jgi:Na+-transporting methylmalonyl-CoA/oxaloacetate decarboxylase beta subunit
MAGEKINRIGSDIVRLSKRALKVIIAVAGVSLLSKLIKVLVSFIPFLASMTQKEAGSIGIIGGADGPTAIFVTTKLIAPLYWLSHLCSVAEIVLFVFLLVKSIKTLRSDGK